MSVHYVLLKIELCIICTNNSNHNISLQMCDTFRFTKYSALLSLYTLVKYSITVYIYINIYVYMPVTLEIEFVGNFVYYLITIIILLTLNYDTKTKHMMIIIWESMVSVIIIIMILFLIDKTQHIIVITVILYRISLIFGACMFINFCKSNDEYKKIKTPYSDSDSDLDSYSESNKV